MLPPPTTTATCTPLRTTSAVWRAMLATVTGSMPSFSPPANASPESFNNTRFHCWSGQSTRGDSTAAVCPRGAGASGTGLEPGETLHRHTRLVEILLHRLLVVADEGLLEQHVVLRS